MKITVVELNGKRYEFTTESFCTQEPFKGKGTSKNKDDRNVLTEFCLLVDEFIKTKELRLLVAWHNINNDERTTYEDEDEGILQEVYRETSIEIPLAVPEQYDKISQIIVDSEVLFARIADELIYLGALKRDEEENVIAEQILQAIKKISDKNPELSTDKILDLLKIERSTLDYITEKSKSFDG